MTVVSNAAGAESSARRPGLGAWLLLSPLLLWLLLFVVAPTAILLVYSFCVGNGPGDVTPKFTTENYLDALHVAFLRIFGRSLVYAVLTTVLCAVIGYPVAYFIGRSTSRVRNRLLLLVMIPFLTSFLIRMYAWFIILHDQGLLNGLLETLHVIPTFISQRIELLYTPTAVVIGLVYTYLPFMILPIYGSVEKLDQSLIEAASDLGAGPMQVFWRVILPLTWPGVAGGISLVFVPSIAMFAITTLMSGGRVRLIGDAIEDQFNESGNLPLGAALGILLLALFLATFLLYPRRRAE